MGTDPERHGRPQNPRRRCPPAILLLGTPSVDRLPTSLRSAAEPAPDLDWWLARQLGRAFNAEATNGTGGGFAEQGGLRAGTSGRLR